jgi:hypothetical protein
VLLTPDGLADRAAAPGSGHSPGRSHTELFLTQPLWVSACLVLSVSN